MLEINACGDSESELC